MRISDWSSAVCSSDLLHSAVPIELTTSATESARAAITSTRRHFATTFSDNCFSRHAYGRPVPSTNHVDRKSVVSGKSVSVCVDLGGLRIFKKKITEKQN